MPLYEYQCAPCGNRFSARRNMADRKHAVCPKCRARADKIFSVVNNTFGWRLTEESHAEGLPDKVERNV